MVTKTRGVPRSPFRGFNLVVDLSAISAQDRLVIVESKPVYNPSKIGTAGCARLYSGPQTVTPWSC